MIRALALAFVLTLIGPALAHDHSRPELNAWFNALQSRHHGLCCDFNEVMRVEDPDWSSDFRSVPGGCKKTIQDERESAEGHYCVRLDGTWWLVSDNALVDGPNKYGMALVWPVYVGPKGQEQLIAIRCFMPGAGI